MVGLISIIIIIVISFVMMMEGWEKYDSQKFYTGLLVIGIGIIVERREDLALRISIIW